MSRIEIGGTKGRGLTNSVQQVHTDFEAAVAAIKAVPYDLMDVGKKQFDDDFYEFRCTIKNLEVGLPRCCIVTCCRRPVCGVTVVVC